MNRCHILPLAFTTLTLIASCAPHSDMPSDAITIDSLLTVAEVYVGDTMTVKGFVKSIDGKSQTVVISDSCDANLLRIDVTGPDVIKGIGKGDAVSVRGVLGESRTTVTDLLKKDAEVDSIYKAGLIGKETYEGMKNDIAAKKAFIEFQKRDYYSEFHIDASELCAH